MTDPLLTVRDLRKTFSARGAPDVEAVRGVGFDIAAGTCSGLVGESGCGKSTTARMVCRLLTPTAGEIRFDGRDIARLKRRELLPFRREVQIVFQDPYSSLNPRHTVGTIIAEPLEVHGIGSTGADRRRRVQELMDRVGLDPDHVNRLPRDFSGGQRQRIGIARALALEPRMLIADEPVSALDVSIQAQILNLLRGLQADLGLTVLFIAHDLSVVRYMCDRIAVMRAGSIVEEASTADLFRAPQEAYTRALLAAVPVPDPDAARADDGERPSVAVGLGGPPPSASSESGSAGPP